MKFNRIAYGVRFITFNLYYLSERGVKSARKIVDASMIDKKHYVTGFIRAASTSGYAAACSRLHIGEVLF